MQNPNIVEIQNFRVQFPGSLTPVFDNISLAIPRRAIFGIFGETGCGKTTLAQYLIGFIPPALCQGTVSFHFSTHPSLPVAQIPESMWRQELRGKKVIYVPQDPYKTLNPYETLGQQLSRLLCYHHVRQDAQSLLSRVGLPATVLSQFPHTLSAGQKQRAIVAQALALAPELLILDEPTASVDTEGRLQLLTCFQELVNRGSTLVVISHELEEYQTLIPPTTRFYFTPLGDVGQLAQEWQADTSAMPLLQMQGVGKSFYQREVISNLDWEIRQGSWVYLEGKNGTGKTTLIQILLGMQQPDTGRFLWQGKNIAWPQIGQTIAASVHPVFQDAFHSLNPRLTIAASLQEVIGSAHRTRQQELRNVQDNLWEEFALPQAAYRMLPGQLSYGQQKRVSILRTILKYYLEKIRRPDIAHLFLLDEIFAGIHGDLRTNILRILAKMRQDHRLSMIWVAHGYHELKRVCDRIYSLESGKLRSIDHSGD